MHFPKDNKNKTRNSVKRKHPGAQSVQSPGILYSRFRPYFDLMLSAENPRRLHLDPQIAYVPHSVIEDEIRQNVESSLGMIVAVVGNKGIGKSTVLRHLFGSISSPSVTNNVLVIPFLADSTRLQNGDVENIIVSQLKSAVDLLEDQFPNLILSEEEFFEFIKGHKRQLLHGAGVSRSMKPAERLAKLEKDKPYQYNAEFLKFAAVKSGVSKVILIVDNIEHIHSDQQKEIIQAAITIRNCLYNIQESYAGFDVSFIFTCRPETYEWLHNDNQVDGWANPRRVHIDSPVDIQSIIAKRVEAAVKKIGPGMTGAISHLTVVNEPEQWHEAYGELTKILGAVADRHGPIVVSLCNNNLRQAMDEIYHALKNSRWITHGNPSSGGFDDLREEQYRTSDAGFFRAITLKAYNIYDSERDTFLANIFYGTYDLPQADLMCCYMMRYFASRDRRSRPISVEMLRSALEICYDKDVLDEAFDDRFSYMKRAGLLSGERIPYAKSDRDKEGVLPGRKLFEIWRFLSESSLYHELCRDDVLLYFDRNDPMMPTNLQGGAKRFESVLEMLYQIADQEGEIFRKVRKANQEDRFFRMFGRTSIVEKSMPGVKQSMKRYFFDKDKKKAQVPNSLQRTQGELQAYLRGVFGTDVS